MTAADWIALAVGIILGPSAYAAAHTDRRWIRDAVNARICPLCGHGCPAAPERSFSDGVRQLGEALDRQKEQPDA